MGVQYLCCRQQWQNLCRMQWQPLLRALLAVNFDSGMLSPTSSHAGVIGLLPQLGAWLLPHGSLVGRVLLFLLGFPGAFCLGMCTCVGTACAAGKHRRALQPGFQPLSAGHASLTLQDSVVPQHFEGALRVLSYLQLHTYLVVVC